MLLSLRCARLHSGSWIPSGFAYMIATGPRSITTATSLPLHGHQGENWTSPRPDSKVSLSSESTNFVAGVVLPGRAASVQHLGLQNPQCNAAGPQHLGILSAPRFFLAGRMLCSLMTLKRRAQVSNPKAAVEPLSYSQRRRASDAALFQADRERYLQTSSK